MTKQDFIASSKGINEKLIIELDNYRETIFNKLYTFIINSTQKNKTLKNHMHNSDAAKHMYSLRNSVTTNTIHDRIVEGITHLENEYMTTDSYEKLINLNIRR